MPKNKKRSSSKSKADNNNLMTDLKGIGLILITIIGCLPFGKVAEIIRGFAAFLVGDWWAFLLILVGVYGGYMMITRKKPTLITAKLMGLYIIIFAVLIISHLNFLKQYENFKFTKNTIDVLQETVGNVIKFVKSGKSFTLSPDVGGGLIGAFFACVFVSLLTIDGTVVVSIALIICGLIMFTGISIYDAVKGTKNKMHSIAETLQNTPSLIKHSNEDDDVVEVTDVADNNEHIDDHRTVIRRDEIHNKPEITTMDSIEENIEQEVKTDVVIDEDYGGENKTWEYPPLNLLNKASKGSNKENQEQIKNNIPILVQVLKDFGIEGKVVSAHVGPSVTQYELEIKAGTRVNKILSLNREIALNLAAKDVRIQAPIPGKSTIGVELPNKKITMVSVREILVSANEDDPNHEKKLLAVLGRDIMGKPMTMEINKTPHLLVAGSTGSGKSVCINSFLATILMRSKPDEVKLVLVDPKKVELSIYNGVPHLLTPVITDPKKANIALKKIVVEMENRYEIFEKNGNKNINTYNDRIRKENESLPDSEKKKLMPYIVVIIDELADLMLVAAKEVEDSIMRITQMARAAGIHLIVATQRPSTDVITGVVKANIPSRISFAVSSGIDSRTILDMVGAEKLLGKGDMLYLPQGESQPIRIQGTFISEEETKSIVDFVCQQQKAHYDETLVMDDEESRASEVIPEGKNVRDATEEPLYDEIVDFVIEQGKASTSLLQRRFRLGYNRAARCIDLLEDRGIIGPQNGSKPREVLKKYADDE